MNKKMELLKKADKSLINHLMVAKTEKELNRE